MTFEIQRKSNSCGVEVQQPGGVAENRENGHGD